DAHNCIPVFDDKTRTSFFAVYDGHGGSEVAKYCELHFPGFVKDFIESTGSLDTDPTTFIQSAFLGFDATLTSDDVIKELKSLAGKEDDLDEDEEDESVYRTETDLLKEEATMPLDQLLAQYSSSSDKGALKENVTTTAECSSSSSENGPQTSVDKPSSSLSVSSSTSNKPSSSTHVNNGKSKPSEDTSTQENNAVEEGSTNNNCESSTSSSSPVILSSGPGTVDGNESKTNKKISEKNAESSPTVSSSTPSSSNKTGSSSKHLDGPSGSSGSSGSGSKAATGVRSSKAKAAADIAKVGADSDDDDDDDEEEEEDVWEDMSDDDDDDDEDADGDEDEDVPMMDTSDEEPGSDSGCTACVLLKQDKKLIVANSGDSRCVLARDGKAIDLSFDHKPEDEPERTRIEKAGGKVTADGRVNGGLNLSRAIGDHVYKRNTEVSAREQMITALPDVQMEELCEKDQFIVIACDGIWNYMSSQEVVDYVLMKLKDPEKRKQPAIICEEMFDHCLAPNTYGDGTGCDNMTCIIIVLDTFHNSDVDGNNTEAVDQNSDAKTEEQPSAPVKRGLDDVDDKETKRLKVEEDGV
ncbi:protein phosphatase 1G, partial [Elysia marginata]